MRKILPGPYVKQDTQAEFPTGNCNVTSLYMAMRASGYGEIPGLTNDVAGTPKKTPVDFLTSLGDSQIAVETMRHLAPQFFPGGKGEGVPTIRPPLAPIILDWIASIAWGGKPSRYVEDLTIPSVRARIDAWRAVVLRTVFTSGGHIVVAVGYETDDATGDVVSVIVRDPWGDPYDYASKRTGNEVSISVDFFMTKVRNPGAVFKLGHLIL